MQLPKSTGAAKRRVVVTIDNLVIDHKEMSGDTTHCDLKIKPRCVVEVFDDDLSISIYTPEGGWE